jgi:biopolymer transport protein ExbD
MAFGTQDDNDEVMNEINMTPLVDIMLVLLSSSSSPSRS